MIPTGSTWLSYDGSEVYLVLGECDSERTRIVVLLSDEPRRFLAGLVTVVSNGYLTAGKRIA